MSIAFGVESKKLSFLTFTLLWLSRTFMVAIVSGEKYSVSRVRTKSRISGADLCGIRKNGHCRPSGKNSGESEKIIWQLFDLKLRQQTKI